MHENESTLGSTNPDPPGTNDQHNADNVSNELTTREAHWEEIPSQARSDAHEVKRPQAGPPNGADQRAERLLAWEKSLSKWNKIRRIHNAVSSVWATVAAFAVAATIAILIYVMYQTDSLWAAWTELGLCLLLALWHVTRFILHGWVARTYAISRRLSQ